MFSSQHQDMNEIFRYYHTTSKSLNYYREGIASSKITNQDYIGLTKNELIKSFDLHLAELEKNTSFNILSTIEASFRIDYIIRTKKKYKDHLSRKFRNLYKSKGENVSLENEILLMWKSEYPNLKSIISNFIGALKYRHWLAHGRYWIPKLDGKYDISTISAISDSVYTNLPLKV